MQTSEKPAIALQIVKWTLYVLAALVFVVGLIAALSLFNTGPALQGFAPLLGGFLSGPIANLLVSGISQAATSVGVAVLVVALIGAALLFACGNLLAQTGNLRRRVARLEAALAAHVAGEHAAE